MPPPLILTAMPRETRALRPLAALPCGTRPHARAIAERAIRDRSPRTVIIAGVCGGLDPALRPGDVVVATTIHAPGLATITPAPHLIDPARHALEARAIAHSAAPLLTVDSPLSPRASRDAARATYGAAAVDMETHDLAAAAIACGVGWIAVRVVLDPTADELPPSLQAWSGERDRDVALRALLRPREWPAYVRLARQWRIAAASMKRAIPAVAAAIEALTPPP